MPQPPRHGRAKPPSAKPPSATLVRRAQELLPRIEERLRHRYGPVPVGHAPLGNKRNPLDELIYIQLSVRTRESTYQSTYAALRRLARGSWERLLDVPVAILAQVLEGGGMGQVKAERLRGQLLGIRARFGRTSLAPLRRMEDAEIEGFLRSLPGVGPKVARCVMLYSLDREVFPVDSNCRRVLSRVGLLPPQVHVKAGHDFLQQLVPKHLRRSLHVNLVHHGRAICVPGNPRCEVCPIVDLCATGRSRVRSRPSR